MVSKYLVLMGFLLMHICCRPPKSEAYNYRIPEAKMIKMMLDVQIVEGALASFSEKQRDSVRSLYMTQFYKIHNIEQTSLDSIFEDLRHNTELYYYVNRVVADSLRSLESGHK